MIEGEDIVRIGALGDGVTRAGRHVPLAVPGDRVSADDTVIAGDHHLIPPCRHFLRCGNCQLQHADEEVLRNFVTDRVLNAARQQQISPDTRWPTHLSPPASRRRATLHALRIGKRMVLGYHEARSRRLIDVFECPVLLPELARLIDPLRNLLDRFAGRDPIDVSLTVTDQGPDCHIKGLVVDKLEAFEALSTFAAGQRLARLSIDQGHDVEILWEPEPVTVRLSGVTVEFPVAAFLQPTRDGEERLVADTLTAVAGSRTIADLFAGLGTFAFATIGQGRKIVAVEASRVAHLACAAAAQRQRSSVQTLHRDLFRAPLQSAECAQFDAVILDPPRAGAKAQVAQLASSTVETIVYVSCNPSSWARDAACLIAGGYRLQSLRPVGQFRWSTHVELFSAFRRV